MFTIVQYIPSIHPLRRRLGAPFKQGTTELVSLDLWPSSEMSLLSTVFLVFGLDLFFPSSLSDLTLESPSIRQASSRTKPRNAASIFDGASRTDVHKK